MLAPLPLTLDEVATLEACSLRGPHPRQRRRAQAILGHHRGQTLGQLAQFFAVRYATVHAWAKAWQTGGIAGLAEGVRSGRPPKQTHAVKKKVADWLGTATQQLRHFVPRLAQELGVSLSVRTLRRLARKLGYCWKRCRRSLKAKRDAEAFGLMKSHLQALHQAEARGEVAVVYADECRFSRQAPVPYAWQLRGAPAVALPAEREAGGQSVLGFWQPGVAGQPLSAYALPGAWNAEAFVGAVDEFVADHVRGPTVLVLDNASIHRAACVRERQAEWHQKGLTICFLPAYSPELNKIERLWRHCKHYWLTPADYACDRTLQERVAFILKNVGTRYTVTFG